MTETTKKESLMASLILSNEGVPPETEGEEPRVTDTSADSLFANVPIVGDSGDVAAAGSLPFSLKHGDAPTRKQESDAIERAYGAPELQIGRVVESKMESRLDSLTTPSARTESRSYAPEESIVVDGQSQSDLFYNDRWSGREQHGSLGNGNHQPMRDFGGILPSGPAATNYQSRTMPATLENQGQWARHNQPFENTGFGSAALQVGILQGPPAASAATPTYPHRHDLSTNTDKMDFSGMPRQSQNATSHPEMGTRLYSRPDASSHSLGSIVVSDPLLISSSGVSLFGLRQPPHWSYQIQTTFQLANTGQGNWVVRRRFRHVVALEERLRHECPGAILPPRPDKHAARALEEATAHQSTEFALHRALELQIYLNALAQHPHAMYSNALRLFLSLQDDLGTAWVEVSSNALTRLANVGVGAAIGLSETTSRGLGVFQQEEFLPEDSAELISLQATESSRMGAVSQAVPKLEGCISLLREHVEATGSVGIEFQKAKLLEDLQPFELLANGMLRSARRTKRSIAELATSAQVFVYHFKLLRYEKLAFADRKQALLQRAHERGKADSRAAQLAIQQRQLGGYNAQVGFDEIARDASFLDQLAMNATKECDEIGKRVVTEVGRIADARRTEWSVAVVTIAKLMKEATSERVSIWASVRDQYRSSFPEL